jgi:hypothetical protein
LPANSLATRSVAGKARSYSYGLLAETMTKAGFLQLGPPPFGDPSGLAKDAAPIQAPH